MHSGVACTVRRHPPPPTSGFVLGRYLAGWHVSLDLLPQGHNSALLHQPKGATLLNRGCSPMPSYRASQIGVLCTTKRLTLPPEKTSVLPV